MAVSNTRFRPWPGTWRPGVIPTALGILMLGRLPSFFEPHWYTDEAGYATTAQGLLDGKILYAEIWNNKPPLHLWTVAIPLRLFGPSEAGLHLFTLVAALATLAAVAWCAPKLLPRRRAAGALIACAVLLGLPVFDAELAIPESFLIAFAAWAAAIVLVKLKRGEGGGMAWVVGVGLLSAAAIAYQQTALADSVAIGLILLLGPPFRFRQVLVYAAAVLLPTAAWLLTVVALAGWQNVAFALAGFYIPFTQSVLPSHGPGLAVYAAGIAAALALAVAGAALHRRSGTGWAVGLWAVLALLVPAAAHQPYPHYVLPSVVPVVLFAAGLKLRLPERRVQLAGAAAIGVAALVAALMARGAGIDWIPPLSSQGYNGYRTLTAYYADAVGSLANTHSLEAWQNEFDLRVSGDRAVTVWVRQKHLQGSSAVVWSSDAWLYATAHLKQVMPTAPIYNDFVLLGMDGQVSARVRTLAPDLIITADSESDEFPEIRPVLVDAYREVFTSGPDTVWMRSDLGFP